MTVTSTEVQALLAGRNTEPYDQDQAVFNVVLERLMEERSIETYDDLHAMFTDSRYEMDLELFMDDCYAESEELHPEFVRGVVDVLELGQEEQAAFALAITFGRSPEE
jgi:hypothetical protein